MEYVLWFWRSYPVAVDMALYFFVFAAAARVAFAKTFPGHEGKLLSVAVGLLLAVGLAIAQRTLGFSTESLGPVAVSLLCGVVFLAAYNFIARSGVSKPLAVLLSALLGLALARAAMPRTFSAFLSQNPLLVLLILGGLVYWAWHGSSRYAGTVENRAPGAVLARGGVVPDQATVAKERRYAKKRIRGDTREDRGDEKHVRNDSDHALRRLEKEGVTPGNRNKVTALVERVKNRARQVRQRHERLAKLDTALARFDLHWLRKAYGIDWSRLTPEQQEVLKRVVLDQRRELHTEKDLADLEAAMQAHAERMEQYSGFASQTLREGNSAATEGWLAKVMDEEKRLEELDNQALALEKRLLRFLKDQRRTTEMPA